MPLQISCISRYRTLSGITPSSPLTGDPFPSKKKRTAPAFIMMMRKNHASCNPSNRSNAKIFRKYGVSPDGTPCVQAELPCMMKNKILPEHGHFPIQKREKISSRTSGAVDSPVISASSRRAARIFSAASSYISDSVSGMDISRNETARSNAPA